MKLKYYGKLLLSTIALLFFTNMFSSAKTIRISLDKKLANKNDTETRFLKCSANTEMSRLSQKWHEKYSNARKKKAFIHKILLFVHKENQKILNARSFLKNFKTKLNTKKSITAKEKSFILLLLQRYKLPKNYSKIPDLLKRMDIIPYSLALAQSVLESGWGTSCAAKEKNSYFGHMATRSRVACFPSLEACVIIYIHNLNTNGFYKKLRELRHQLRLQGKRINGIILAQGLAEYCSRKQAYINEIIKLIKSNRLDFFDEVLPQF